MINKDIAESLAIPRYSILTKGARSAQTQNIVGKIELSLDRQNGAANLAYYTFREFQKKGYAKEACTSVIKHVFSEWNCEMIFMEMDTNNLASIALAEALGGTRIKLIPKAQQYKGAWHDEYRYEINSPLK